MKFDATLIIFIDGLDECENTASRIESLRFLLDWVESAATASLTVRLCISGRPETEIDGRLTRGHVLMLQDFTKNDIYHYIHMELNHPSIAATRDYFDYKSIKNNLISSIVIKAATIFLWEFLILREFKHSIEQGEDDVALQRHVDEQSGHLYDLSTSLLKRTYGQGVHPEKTREYLALFLFHT